VLKGGEAVWFKVDHSGYYGDDRVRCLLRCTLVLTCKQWGTTSIIKNGTYSVKIPSTLLPGNYLIRYAGFPEVTEAKSKQSRNHYAAGCKGDQRRPILVRVPLASLRALIMAAACNATSSKSLARGPTSQTMNTWWLFRVLTRQKIQAS
jgi:hypothetical protein